MIFVLQKIREYILQQDRSFYSALLSISSLRVVEKLSGFLISVFIFRLLTKEEVASYGFIQTIVALCAVFGIQEFQSTINQSVARGFYGTFLKSVPVAFLMSFIGSFIISMFSFYYFLANNDQMAWGFLVAAFIFPFSFGLAQWKSLLLGEKRFADFSKAEAANAIVKAFLIVSLILIFPHEIIWPIVAYLAVPATQNIYRILSLIRRIDKKSLYEEGSMAYGFKASLYSAASIVAGQIDKIILFAFLPPASLAIYMAAEKFSDSLQGIVQDISAILAPKFAIIKNYSSELDKRLKILASLIGIGILFFAFAILPYLLPFILGNSYNDSVILSQILICGGAVRNIASLRFRFIRSKIDEKSFRQITVYSAIAHILASIILVPIFGLYGAVASVFIQRMVLSLIVGHITKTRYLAHEQ